MTREFRKLVKQQQNRVYTMAVYMLRDRGEAEDVTQETFEKLWHRWDSLEHKHIGSWLLLVCRNACLDRIRRRKEYQDVSETEQADDRCPAKELEQLELKHWLKTAIAGLKEPYRSLVILHDIQQHSYQEIATILELSMEQVKVYLYRARRELRNRLQEVKS